MNRPSKLLLFLILVIAIILRIYKVSNYPQGLYWDEVAIGYNSYSILETGKDEYGNSFPITFESFQDSKLPLYIYLTSLSYMLFGVTPFAVRFVSIISGVLSVYLVFLISQQLVTKTKSLKIPLTAALFMAISPWALQFSRAGFEANASLCISLVAIYFFINFIQKTKDFYKTIIFTCIAFYFYYQAWVFLPLLFFTIIFFSFTAIKTQLKKISVGIILSLLLLSPLIHTFFLSNQETRLKHVENVFTNPEVIKESIDNRVHIQNPYVGMLLYNRHVVRVNAFLKSYIEHFSPSYLFFTGDPNPRHSPSDIGMMHVFLLPFFVLGLIYSVARMRFARLVILPWLIYSPVSAALSTPVPHALRSLLMLPIVEIIAAIGMVWTVNTIRKKTIHLLFIVSSVVIVIISGFYFFFYLHNYYIVSNKNSSYWAYGYKEVFDYLTSVEDQYDQIYVTGKYWRPYIFMLFYMKYSPQEYQAYGNHTNIGKYWFGHASYDSSDPHYIYSDTLINEIRTKDNNLLILSPEEVVSDDTIIQTIYFLDNKPAFVIVSSRPELQG